MKYLLSALLLSTALNLTACNEQRENSTHTDMLAKTTKQKPQVYPAALFHKTTNFRLANSGGYAFSHDGSKVLISSDKTGIFNSYTLDVEGDKIGKITPLTTSTNFARYAQSFFPQDDRIIVQGDQGGNELDHVFVRLEDGEFKDLTPGENLKARFVSWSSDGNTLYISTNERDPGSNDLYAYDPQSYTRKLVFENDLMYLGAMSNNGQYLSLVKQHSSANADIFIADIKANSKAIHITPHKGNVAYESFSFTSDSTSLIYGTSESSEFTQAWSHDLTSGQKTPLIQANWDVRYVSYSPSGRYRISTTNNDALTELSIFDTKISKNIILKDIPEGELSQVRFNKNESQISFGLNSDTSPINIYIANLSTGITKRLTNALPENINENDLVTAKVIRYKSFDGLEIPAILYMPKQATPADPVPALVWVHGGPGGQSTRGYSAMIQHMVNNGYAILAANNRGSSGYGKTFYHLDDRRHGEEDLLDIVYARKYLETLAEIDDTKIGVGGGSYGGFMTVAALAFHPEVFDVGVNIFGVTNWERTLKSIPDFWGAFRAYIYDEMGDPETNSERHRKISPLFSAYKITKPLYVMQGANDPRVLQIESDEMVAAVRANNVPVEYVLFPDEGHGIQKRENRITNSEQIVKFLDTYLKQ